MYERHLIITGGLPFGELKARSLINSRAQSAGAAPDFSQLIRVGLPNAMQPPADVARASVSLERLPIPPPWLQANSPCYKSSHQSRKACHPERSKGSDYFPSRSTSGPETI
jgi:hypothetical protein